MGGAAEQQQQAPGFETELAPVQESHDVPEATGVLPHGDSCYNCGAVVDNLDSFCSYCGAQHSSPAQQQQQQQQEPQQRYFQCGNCGSKMGADVNQRSYVCPFCDAAQVAEFSPDMTGRQEPEFVIGFETTMEQAIEKFRHWVKAGGLFRPGDLKGAEIEGKLRGIYIPFWSFSMHARSDWSAQIGEYWYRTETYTTTDSQGKTVTRTRTVRETEWWPLSGKHHRFYSHYMVSGSQGLPQEYADRVKPFHNAALHRYKPHFLAGWLSEEYSVERDAAMQVSMQEFHRREHQHISTFLPGDTHNGLQVQTQFSRTTSDLCLLPIYLATYRYRDKQYRFLINGQTGKIAGDKPLSWIRITLFVLFILGLIAGAVVLAMQMQ